MTTLAIVDVETTGLDPHYHEMWEVALILRTPKTRGRVDENEHVWQLPVNLTHADQQALDVGRFHERRADIPDRTDPGKFADEFARLTWGAHLVGANVRFDEEFLRKQLRRHGQCPGWNYHLVDVEALAAGFMAWRAETLDPRPPWKSADLFTAVGIDATQYEKHTALGDARLARDVYDAVFGTFA